MTLVYVIVILPMLCGFASLGVDWGRVQMVKTQLQRASDAAARAAITGLVTNVTTAQNMAVLWGGKNSADGTSVVIDPINDVEFGTWDTTNRTFTVLSGAARSNADAIRVTARRTTARGNPVPTVFGQTFGMNNCDVNGVAIAWMPPFAAYEPFSYATGALVGQNGGTGWSNAWSGSTTNVVAASLSHPSGGLPTAGGAAQKQNSGNTNMRRDLTNSFGQTAGPMWISFLINPGSLNSSRFMGLMIGSGVGGQQMYIAYSSGLWTMEQPGGVNAIHPAGATPVAGVTAFLVVRIDLNPAGNDFTYLYVNPTRGIAAPDVSYTLKSDTDFGLNQTAIFINGGGNTNPGRIDEIRIGSTYQAVAP